MTDTSCGRCGNKSLLNNFISKSCPLCGEYAHMPKADEGLLWAEHRLGLLFNRDGWHWLSVTEPPAWFLENVV